MASHSADEGRVSKGTKRKNKEQMELESNFQRKRQKPAADVRNADTKSPKSNSEHQKNSSGSADIINCQAEIPSVELCGTGNWNTVFIYFQWGILVCVCARVCVCVCVCIPD